MKKTRAAFYMFLFALLMAQGAGVNAQKRQLNFLSYNVLHGFENDSSKMDQFVNWVKQRNPDIIAYQELNGFDLDKLERLAARFDHPYVVINTEGVTHPIALTSKHPIVMVQKVTENTWHSYLYGNIEGVHVFVTHLSPFDVVSRRNDARRLMAHIKLLPANEPVIVAGDMNALAASDSANYSPGLLADMKKSEGRLEPKSGLPIVKGKTIYRHNLHNGRLDYSVTNLFLQGGLTDAVRHYNNAFLYSVPSKSFQKGKSYLRRIDFVFVNKQLVPAIKEATVWKDAVTDELSDHYPVWLKLEMDSRP